MLCNGVREKENVDTCVELLGGMRFPLDREFTLC